MPVIEFAAITDEVFAMLIRVRRSLAPEHMSELVRERFREDLVEQATQAFAGERVPDGGRWSPLSQKRIEARGGSAHPILVDTGGFADEVKSFKGKMRVTSGANEGFSYWFPDFPEMSGQYWGLTAGQLVNPLGGMPLAAVPRPVFAGVQRQTRDTTKVLVEYFMTQGYEVEVV